MLTPQEPLDPAAENNARVEEHLRELGEEALETAEEYRRLDAAAPMTIEELAEIDRAARARLGAEAAPPERISPEDIAGPLDARRLANEGRLGQVRFVHRCQGGCSTPVGARGDWCGRCAAESRKVAVGLALAAAYESVSPEGSRGWCRPGEPDFERAMGGTREKPGIRELYRRLPAESRDKIRDNAVLRSSWRHDYGSLALVGPTGIGKSALLSAIALGALDTARSGKVAVGSPDFLAIAGIRYVSGLDLAKDEKRHRLGDGQSPLIRLAKQAPILILDEVGFGDDAGEISAIREVFRHRFERGREKPILFGSGRRVEELNLRFGEATMRCLWGRGRIVDLHPPVLARAPS